MTRCKVVTVAIDGETETFRVDVHEDFGSVADVKAFADLVRAGRKRWAATSHPEPLTVACPRCGAEVEAPCTTTGGKALPWGHRERHAAAIEADGRTCAAEESAP